jgi:Flp pilus assembly protein TadD
MRFGVSGLLLAACLLALAGCGSLTSGPNGADPAPTGSIAVRPVPADPEAVPGALLGGDPNTDDLNLGKRHYREQNYGLAEKHFRRAVEKLPKDGEGWLGLAASYDKLRRFDLADRAYNQVLEIYGPTPEVLNNIGYSYLLRGDFKRARIKLTEAAAKDPENPYIRNNVELLEITQRHGKGLR